MTVQTLDKNGEMVEMWYWIDVTDGDDVYYGWLNGDGDFVEKGDVTLSVGEGLWVDAPSTDYRLQSAGMVLTGTTQATLREGFKMVANPTPVAIDLTSVVVAGYDAEAGSEDEVTVQTLDKNGEMVEMWYWIDVTDGDDVYYGWLNGDGDFIEAGDVVVGAGEALWVDAPSGEYSLVLPGVSL